MFRRVAPDLAAMGRRCNAPAGSFLEHLDDMVRMGEMIPTAQTAECSPDTADVGHGTGRMHRKIFSVPDAPVADQRDMNLIL